MACERIKPPPPPPPPPPPDCEPPKPPPKPECEPEAPPPKIEPECPKLVSSTIHADRPIAEIRRIEYDKDCVKSGQFGSDKKKSGLESCCETPAPTKRPNLIMSPPPYADLGKNARDVFSKGYHFGLIKLDVKTKSASGVEFNSGGQSNQENGKVFGSLETKYKVKEYGLTFAEKWNTDNTLGSEVTVQDQLMKGLKLGAEFNFAPQSGNKSGALKSAFQNETVALNADVKFPDSNTKPTINASAVVGYQGWLAGYQTAYDTENKKLSKNNFALGFSTGDFILHTNVDVNAEGSDDGNEFGGSIYQRVSPRLETGITLAWQSGSNNTKFGVGAKYDLDKDASIRAKVNNASQVGLGYQQRLRDGIVLTLSAMVDGKNFNSGGHKIGLALELEA